MRQRRSGGDVVARVLFGSAAAFNVAVGLPLLAARPKLMETLSLDPVVGTNVVAANLVAGFVLLFGLIYALVALRPAANRNFIAPMVVGKLIAVVGATLPWLAGEIDGRLPALALPDLLFAVAFVAYLRLVPPIPAMPPR